MDGPDDGSNHAGDFPGPPFLQPTGEPWRVVFRGSPALYVRQVQGAPVVRVIPNWPSYTQENTDDFSQYNPTPEQILAFEVYTISTVLGGLGILSQKVANDLQTLQPANADWQAQFTAIRQAILSVNDAAFNLHNLIDTAITPPSPSSGTGTAGSVEKMVNIEKTEQVEGESTAAGK